MAPRDARIEQLIPRNPLRVRPFKYVVAAIVVLVAVYNTVPSILIPMAMALFIFLFAWTFVSALFSMTRVSGAAHRLEERRKELAAWAGERGHEFEATPPHFQSDAWLRNNNDIPIFSHLVGQPGAYDDQKARADAHSTPIMARLGTLPVTNLVSGNRDGFSFRVFDYTASHSQQRFRLTMVLLDAPDCFPKAVYFRPKLGAISRKIAGAFQGPEVSLTQHPRVAAHYTVFGEHPEVVERALRSGGEDELLLVAEHWKNAHIWVRDHRLALYRGNGLIRPEFWDELIDDAVRVAKALVPHGG